MVVVKAPLFSLGASGTLGGAIVYSTWKGRDYCRRHAVPANPRVPGQLSMRASLKFLAQYWDSLTENQQADWLERAALTNISPFNAYVAYNQSRWGTNLAPSKLDPATDDPSHGGLSGQAATAGVRSIELSIEVTTASDNWGIHVYRSLTTPVGGDRNELVHVIPAEDLGVFTWLDFPLPAAVTQYYKFQAFGDTGTRGSLIAEVSATPTA